MIRRLIILLLIVGCEDVGSPNYICTDEDEEVFLGWHPTLKMEDGSKVTSAYFTMDSLDFFESITECEEECMDTLDFRVGDEVKHFPMSCKPQ